MKKFFNKCKNSLANFFASLSIAPLIKDLKANKPGAITMIEIIIIIVVVVAIAIIFKEFLSGVVTDVGESVKTSISSLFSN